MKTNKYTIEDAAGKISTFTIPTFLDPFHVAQLLPHSLLYFHVKSGHSCFGYGYLGKIEEIVGPAFTMVIDNNHYRIPSIPKTEAESYRIWKEYSPKSKVA